MPRKPLPAIKTCVNEDGRYEAISDVWTEFLNDGFLAVPNTMLRFDLGVEPLSKLVLLTLMSWTNRTNVGQAVRSRGRPIRLRHLMEWTGLTRRMVMRCLDELEKAEYIAVLRSQGEPNEYFIIHVEIMNACVTWESDGEGV